MHYEGHPYIQTLKGLRIFGPYFIDVVWVFCVANTNDIHNILKDITSVFITIYPDISYSDAIEIANVPTLYQKTSILVEGFF